jgi:hypothetical protein
MHPTHPRRRPWPTVLLLAVTALLLALFAVVLVAPPVGAHALGGVEPSNYRARVLAVRPPVPGLTVEVVDAGARLRLVNTGPRDVVVLGYQLEPWLRVGPRGVFENSRSPTLQMAGPRRADSPPPAAVDPGAPASWRRVDRGQSVTWHDHRAHWEADQPPAQVRRAPGSPHLVIPEWTVKLRTGGHLVDVVGEVRWVPGPSPLPWLAGAALLAMAVVAAGAWMAAQAPLASKLLSLAASAAGWVVAGLAIRQLLRHRVESGLFQLLLAAGLLTVVGGLGDLGFLLRSQLASTLPDWMVRAAVTARIGLGLGALAAAGLRLHSTLAAQVEGPDQPEEPADWPEEGVDSRGHAPGADGAAEDEPVLATVLPWPGGRRLDTYDLDDPDLPGGA